MRDSSRPVEIVPGVMAFDFRGGRIAAMNDMILEEMRTAEATGRDVFGDNILGRRAKACLFARNPLPPGLAALRGCLYSALREYLVRCKPHLAGLPFRHRSWCNHYRPNEGMPWHDHRNTPVVAVYAVKGDGGDLILEAPDDPRRCYRIETPPGRLLFLEGAMRHCSTPNFGPRETRVTLPVNFTFAGAPAKPEPDSRA